MMGILFIAYNNRATGFIKIGGDAKFSSELQCEETCPWGRNNNLATTILKL